MASVIQERLRQRFAVLTLALVSASGLIFEITLTRIFSLYFQYHFAFLAVSVAVFGLSLGATWEYLTRPKGGPPKKSAPVNTVIWLLTAISLTLLAVTAVIAWFPFADSVVPQTILALLPFVLIGRLMSFIFARDGSMSGRLYAADLIGAATGVVVVMALLNVWSAFSMVFALATLIGLLAVGLKVAHAETSAFPMPAVAPVAIAGVAILIVNIASGLFDFNPARLIDPPRDKTMLTILSDPTQQGRIVRTAWSPFARVDVVETNDPAAKYIFTDGGAGSYMLHFDGNLQSVNYLKATAEYLPFAAVPSTKTLILGAGGGKDIVMAKLANAQEIVALEINQATVNLTRSDAAYNGGILDLPQVETYVEDARTFVERTTDQYDLIYLNLVYTQAAEPANQALIENYIFTREAFRTYLARLKPGGHLAIVTHNALEGSRAALTALAAMQDSGVELSKALDHMLLWRYAASDATLSTSVLLVGKDPLSEQTMKTIETDAKGLGMNPLFQPVAYETLFTPLRNGGTLERFIQADASYDLSPTTDDRPYFFNLDPGLPQPVVSAFLFGIILAASLLAVAFFQPSKMRPTLVLILYAALIGVGFMLVEIPLIQRFALLLGQPALSIAAVLGSLLISSGIGSLISQRWPMPGLMRRVALASLWIVIVAIVYRMVLSAVLTPLLSQPLPVRLLGVVMLTALLGLPMGIPFPSLLRIVGASREKIALLWALNGGFSVFGSILALVISMVLGFGWGLLVGAVLYLAVAGLTWRLKPA